MRAYTPQAASDTTLVDIPRPSVPTSAALYLMRNHWDHQYIPHPRCPLCHEELTVGEPNDHAQMRNRAQ